MAEDNLPAKVPFKLPVDSPVRLLDLSYARCHKCPRLLYCPAINAEKENIRIKFKELYPEIIEELAEQAFATGQSEINPILLEREYKKVLDKVFNRECIYEVEGTHNIVKHIAKDYDITKGKNYLLLRELLTNYMMNFRLDTDIVDNAMFTNITTRSGDIIRIPHAGLKSKLEFSKLMLDYIKQLEAFSKDTVQVKIEGEFSMKQMLDRIIDLDKKDIKVVKDAKEIGDKH